MDVDKEEGIARFNSHDEVPQEWKDKVDNGEAVQIEVVEARMSSMGLTVRLALMAAGLIIAPMTTIPGLIYGLTVGTGAAYLYLYYKAQQLITHMYNAQQIERAGMSALLYTIRTKINELSEGTSEDESCLKEEETGSDTEQVND